MLSNHGLKENVCHTTVLVARPSYVVKSRIMTEPNIISTTLKTCVATKNDAEIFCCTFDREE